jgi:hypothetical protein
MVRVETGMDLDHLGIDLLGNRPAPPEFQDHAPGRPGVDRWHPRVVGRELDKAHTLDNVPKVEGEKVR